MPTPEKRDSNYTQPLVEKDIQGLAIPIPSFLLPFLTYLLPKEIRRAHRSHYVEIFVGGEYSHAMVLLFVSLLTLVSTAGNCVILILFAQTVFLKVCVGLVYVVSNLFLIGGLYLFRRGACSSIFFANTYTLAAFINILGTNLLMGFTWTSPYLPMFIFIPLWAFSVSDMKSALRWVLVTLGVLLSIFLFASFEFEFPQIVPAPLMNVAYFLSWAFILSLVVVCLYPFRTNYEALILHLHKDRVRFAKRAVHDPLTGLANRTLFHDRAEEALNFSMVENKIAAIIFIDLDDFKRVNDIHGHQVGDEVLKLVGQRLRGLVRTVDTVARLGGDEFGIILHGISDRAVVGTICKKFSNGFLEPVVFGGIEILIGGSIGVAIAPDDGSDVNTLMKHADSSMYREKERARGEQNRPLRS